MRYIVNPEIFVRYPGFMRAVIIAEGIDNSREVPQLAEKLAASEQRVRETLGDDFKEMPQLAVWAEVFRGMNINPNKFPPSVTNLVKRVRSGKALPYINTLVAAFNCISLRNLCPCGGDDLDVVQGDLHLTFASGEESYVPLGQPDVVEHPPAGEVVYLDTAAKDVFCRVWCWKNGDRSKLAPETKAAAVNIDVMPPLGRPDAERIAAELAGMLQTFAGAETTVFYLTQETPEFVIPGRWPSSGFALQALVKSHA